LLKFFACHLQPLFSSIALSLRTITSHRISKRLGHAKVSTTTDIYSHIIQQADEQAADKIAETIFRAGKKKSDKKRSGSNSKQMGEFDRFFEVVRQMCATGRITFTR